MSNIRHEEAKKSLHEGISLDNESKTLIRPRVLILNDSVKNLPSSFIRFSEDW